MGQTNYLAIIRGKIAAGRTVYESEYLAAFEQLEAKIAEQRVRLNALQASLEVQSEVMDKRAKALEKLVPNRHQR